jgi:hypothetical protein
MPEKFWAAATEDGRISMQYCACVKTNSSVQRTASCKQLPLPTKSIQNRIVPGNTDFVQIKGRAA